eukprot:126093-Chlamydomonas_euryale.AAC.1
MPRRAPHADPHPEHAPACGGGAGRAGGCISMRPRAAAAAAAVAATLARLRCAVGAQKVTGAAAAPTAAVAHERVDGEPVPSEVGSAPPYGRGASSPSAASGTPLALTPHARGRAAIPGCQPPPCAPLSLTSLQPLPLPLPPQPLSLLTVSHGGGSHSPRGWPGEPGGESVVGSCHAAAGWPQPSAAPSGWPVQRAPDIDKLRHRRGAPYTSARSLQLPPSAARTGA